MPRILIVEDDLSLASMYKFKLEQAGYEVTSAFDGQKGLELAENFLPQLILLDLKMPVMSGDKMLEKLRASDWAGNMRVIVLTNISKAEAPSILRFLSVDRYIVKVHTTPQEVVNIVGEVMGKK